MNAIRRPGESRRQIWIALGLTAVAAIGLVLLMLSRAGPAKIVGVEPAQLSAEARAGGALYARTCLLCHGPNAAGTGKGPPLVHVIYEPSHHDDAAFYRAVNDGVRQHHWKFGDMPPLPGLGDNEIVPIIAYIRALQRANGIE